MRSRLYRFIYVCPNYFIGTKLYWFNTDEEAIHESKVWNHNNKGRFLVYIERAKTTKPDETYFEIIWSTSDNPKRTFETE